jgi:hypothetical protein
MTDVMYGKARLQFPIPCNSLSKLEADRVFFRRTK